MFKNITEEPLKVIDWNSEQKQEKRRDYCLSVMEGGHWFQIGTEIDQKGNTHTVFKYNCEMP